MNKILILIIKIYQKIISPLFPARCKYYPTCSQYAIEALRLHGFFKGSWLAIKRVFRCNPFSKGGIDYVPKPKHGKYKP